MDTMLSEFDEIPAGGDQPRIIVVEYEAVYRSIVARHLSNLGYHVDTVSDPAELDGAHAGTRMDLVLLDTLLHAEDGLSITRRLRERQPNLGIVLITSLGTETDQVASLEAGADAYLPKPASLEMVAATVRSVLRRVKPKPTREPLQRATSPMTRWAVNMQALELVTPDGAGLPLTMQEAKLLAALIEQCGSLVPRTHLLDVINRSPSSKDQRHLNVMMHLLRRRWDAIPYPCPIRTVYGKGFLFAADSP